MARLPSGRSSPKRAGIAMRRMPWAIYLWPGLPQLWRRGLWSGLLLATGFAALVDVMLLASLVWGELLSAFDLRLGWSVLGLLWGGSVVVSARWGRLEPPAKVAEAVEGLFRRALGEYLQGNWFEAETHLAHLLAANPRDVEGRLLRATLLRHTRRYDEALDELSRAGAARKCRSLAAGDRTRTNANCGSTSGNGGSRPLCGVRFPARSPAASRVSEVPKPAPGV